MEVFASLHPSSPWTTALETPATNHANSSDTVNKKNASLFCDDRHSDVAQLSIKLKRYFLCSICTFFFFNINHEKSLNPELCLIYTGHFMCMSNCSNTLLLLSWLYINQFFKKYSKANLVFFRTTFLKSLLLISSRRRKLLASKAIRRVERPGKWVT